MTGKRIGYIRVSTFDQNPSRQLEGLELDERFIEHACAKTTKRPELQNMLRFVRKDDLVIVHSMDRLARNVRDLRNLVDLLNEKKVEVWFVKENLRFNGKDSAMSNLLLSLMGAFAEFEYAFIKERQIEGIAQAKKAGKYRGKKKKLDSDKIEILKQRMKTRDSKTKIAREFGITTRTLNNYLSELNLREAS